MQAVPDRSQNNQHRSNRKNRQEECNEPEQQARDQDIDQPKHRRVNFFRANDNSQPDR